MNFNHTLHLNVPAYAAWHILGERFDDLSWTSSIKESRLKSEGPIGEGTQRVCVSAKSFGPFPASVIEETLTHYDEAEMSFTYEASSLPSLVVSARNRWHIVSTGESTCDVTSQAEVRLAWWARPLRGLFARVLKKDLTTVFEELRSAIESRPASSRSGSHKEVA